MSGHNEKVEALSNRLCNTGERQTMSHFMTRLIFLVMMPPIAHGQTWLFQPPPVSTVPNTGRNLFNSYYRAVDEEEH